MFADILNQLKALGWVQWAAFITGILYIYYATKNKVWCWPWGILSSILWAYASFYQLKLYSDGYLQLIYILLGIWGWYRWFDKKKKEELKISRLSINQWVLLLWVSSLFALAIGYYMKKMGAALPFIDAYLSVFSVTATFLLINRKLENWWWWIVIDLVNIPVFIMRKGYLFAVLFGVYTVLAIKGWREWKKLENEINIHPKNHKIKN